MIICGNYVALLGSSGVLTGVDIVHRYDAAHEGRAKKGLENHRIYDGETRICAKCGVELESDHFLGVIRESPVPNDFERQVLETLFAEGTVQVSAITDGVGSCGHLLDTIIRFVAPPTVLGAISRQAN